MLVTLTLEDVSSAQDHGSIVRVTGSAEDGSRVTFGGDHRPMGQILEALVTDQEFEITVEVEDWQILGVQSAVTEA